MIGAIFVKFSQLILTKIIKIVATRCQILRLNDPSSISDGALPQTLLGKLTVIPQTSWLDLRGLLLRQGRGLEGRGPVYFFSADL